MKKTNFFRHFVETLPATSLLGMLLLAPMGASAQVTIGSDALPQATLDVVGTYPTAADKGKAFRLDDGNQAPGKVLICQDNGVGTWQNFAMYEIEGVKGGRVNFPLAPDNSTASGTYDFRQTGGYITLPPGKWEVQVYTLIAIIDVSTNPTHQYDLTANDFAWVRSSFTEDSNAEGDDSIITPDILGGQYISGRVSGPKPSPPITNRTCWGMIAGAVIINNTSDAPKTYYYIAGSFDTDSNFTSQQVILRVRADGQESKITATPIL